MKNQTMSARVILTVLIGAIMYISVLSVHAQKKHGGTEFQNIIKINPIGMAFGQYQLAYERALGEKTSAQLSVGYITLPSSYSAGSSSTTTSYESVTSGVIIIPEYRFYFKEAAKGLYAAGVARIRLVTDNLEDTSSPMNKDVSYQEKVNTIGGALVLGYQYLVMDRICVDLFVGPQYKSRSTDRTYNTAGVTDDDFNEKFIDFKIKDKSGFGVRCGVNVGFAF